MSWPNISKLQQRDPYGDSLIIQSAPGRSNTTDMQAFLCGQGDGDMGGVMIGTLKTWLRLSVDIAKLVSTELLPKNYIGNEQMLTMLLHERNRSQFSVIPFKCPESGCKSGEKSALPIIDLLV